MMLICVNLFHASNRRLAQRWSPFNAINLIKGGLHQYQLTLIVN